MGGNKQQKKFPSSNSFFGLFKGRRPRRGGDDGSACGYDDVTSSRKVRPFEDDGGPLVAVKADPRIDSKASVFIANFYAARISESERQIFQQAAGKAA